MHLIIQTLEVKIYVV